MAFDVSDAQRGILPGPAAKLTGMADVPALIFRSQQADDAAVWFLPYLSGERTPHNNPKAKGVFFGLTHQHGPAELARGSWKAAWAALADGMDVVHDCGLKPTSVTLIGGGARSPLLATDAGGYQPVCSWISRTGGMSGLRHAARLAQIHSIRNSRFATVAAVCR